MFTGFIDGKWSLGLPVGLCEYLVLDGEAVLLVGTGRTVGGRMDDGRATGVFDGIDTGYMVRGTEVFIRDGFDVKRGKNRFVGGMVGGVVQLDLDVGFPVR